MYKGAQWFTFKKSTVEFILNYIATNAWFYELFEHSICADEVFFHTVFKINQELKIFRNSRYLNSELRYIDWKSGPEYPKMLNVSDMVAMKSSNCLFARKLPPDADKGFMNSFYLKVIFNKIINRFYMKLKRFMDITISVVAIIILLPIYAIVAYKVKKTWLSSAISSSPSRFVWSAV
jgi:hypothetical protein